MIFSKVFLVSRYTFLEIFKSKIMMSGLILAGIIVLVSSVASEFTYGVPEKVALDFSLGLLTVSLIGISIFMGSSLLASEIENRTLYMVLSRNIYRWQFLIGRILGMLAILGILSVFLGIVGYLCFLAYGGKQDPLIFWSILFVYFESMITLSIVILFSLLTNRVMTVLYSIGMYLMAHALTPSLDIPYVQLHPFLKKILYFFSYVFPDFYKINIKNYVLYDHNLSFSYLFNQSLYCLFYFVAVMLLVIQIFSKKNLD